MKLNIQFVDAFTDKQFKGNSAAVIIVDDWLEDALMQSIAMENNLSETAFVQKVSEHFFNIRWFSPLTEIDFCGHASLASAFVIFNADTTLSKITFFAQAVGEFTINKLANSAIQMCFESREPKNVTTIPTDLLNGLSIKPQHVLKNEQAYFAIYPNEEDVIAVVQDIEFIKKLAPLDVVVTAPSTKYDFVSRYFWPANGGEEDPVTGSIHTGLVPYWAKKLNKSELVAYQASSRGGVISCKISNTKVWLSGNAVAYLTGEINIAVDVNT